MQFRWFVGGVRNVSDRHRSARLNLRDEDNVLARNGTVIGNKGREFELPFFISPTKRAPIFISTIENHICVLDGLPLVNDFPADLKDRLTTRLCFSTADSLEAETKKQCNSTNVLHGVTSFV